MQNKNLSGHLEIMQYSQCKKLSHMFLSNYLNNNYCKVSGGEKRFKSFAYTFARPQTTRPRVLCWGVRDRARRGRDTPEQGRAKQRAQLVLLLLLLLHRTWLATTTCARASTKYKRTHTHTYAHTHTQEASIIAAGVATYRQHLNRS